MGVKGGEGGVWGEGGGEGRGGGGGWRILTYNRKGEGILTYNRFF